MLALVLLLASWIHPGADQAHHLFLETVAREAPSPEVAAELLVYAEHESRFGAALSGRRWDHLAYGILQVRGNPRLEVDEVASVGAWLRIRARAAEACGESGALAGLSSGRCDRGTRLASERAAEARWWLGLARLADRRVRMALAMVAER
jgi:hypothetical protein